MTLRLLYSFYQLKNQRNINGPMNDIGQQSTHVSPIWGENVTRTYGKGSVVAMLNKYKQLHNLTVFRTQYPALMSRKEQYISLQPRKSN